MANTEFQFKIIEKHLSGLEKKIDQIDKSISALEKKHDVIEKMVFAMAPMVKDPAKFLKEAGGMDKDIVEKMTQANTERAVKDMRKEMDQQMDKAEKINAKVISDQLKYLVDARLKGLEAQVSVLMKLQR